MNEEIQKQILELTEHNIPFYAYGDNEAACELSRRLNEVASMVSQVEPEVLLPERNSFGQWILCADKMPDEINSLAVSSSKWIVASKDDAWLEDRHPVWWDEYGIIKWMPLPKP